MEEVYVGKIVATHGIKGEVRILSSFPYKEKAFLVGSSILIDHVSYKIMRYRVHKQYDMLTLEGFTNINEVLPFLKKKVYKEKAQLALAPSELLLEEFLTYTVKTTTGITGQIVEVIETGRDNKVMRVMFMTKTVLIPLNATFIYKIDHDAKCLYVSLLDGMLS